jgi:hypothetical protein
VGAKERQGPSGPDTEHPPQHPAGYRIEFIVRHFLSVVFGAAFTCATAWSIGRLLFARLKIALQHLEHDLLAGVTGAALLSLLVFALCAVRLATVPVFWAVGLIAMALNWKFRSAPTLPTQGAAVPLPRIWKWLAGVPFAFYGLLYLSNSLAPENSPDGQAYHLGLVYRYFRLHGFERLTTNMYANLSQGMEMLFLFAFAFGRHAAAATVHCCFLFALPLMMFSYGRRIGRPIAGACAGMLVYLSPLAGIDGVSAYNDVALAAAGFATFYLLEIWRGSAEDRRPALLVPIGLLAGFCFAIKYTGFVAAFYAIAMMVWESGFRRSESRKRTLAALATVTAMLTLMAAPWLIKNWLWLGNPVSPFFNREFPNQFTHVTFEDAYRRYLSTYDLPDLKPWFWIVTVKGQLEGQIGPVFLLAPLALLSLRLRDGRRILLAGLFFLLPYPQNIGARFLIPALPFIAIGIAMALEFSRATQAALVFLAALLAWPKIIDRYRAPAGGWQISTLPWKAALGIIPQDTWLQQRDGGWVTARMLDEFVPEGKRVWSTEPVAESYSKTDVLVNYYSAEGELIQDILLTPAKPDLQPLWNLRYTFYPQTMQRLRLVQSANNLDIWSIGEIRFFLGDREIQPAQRWKLEASSFPWDIGLAFDRNPVTRWRSWEPIRAGMYVGVDFGEPVTLDRVDLHSSHDQWNIEVGLQGIRTSLEKLDDKPPGDLRRLATATIKARGIDYLLLGGDRWLPADIRGDPGRWGLTKVAERGDDWLFQIQ